MEVIVISVPDTERDEVPPALRVRVELGWSETMEVEPTVIVPKEDWVEEMVGV